jgi:glycosyltransferase involved in cell wall biosynthesis
MPVLQAVAQRHSIILRIVGAGRVGSFPGVNVDNRSWTLHSELSDLQSFDIGLYPISDDVWSKGKSGFKAVQYMAVGIPTACSPVGAPLDIVEDGVNGFFASNDVEWENRLCQLIEDAALRQCLGAHGRKRVEEWYCLAHQAPRLQKTLLEAV